ncbi:group II intron reverse transcriptase/maturase, partial [Streptomyces antimycoticus]|uniref:group II intron reverse transcriptase/maturase n=1 Tax=Streptomyces antimycoticus TaxID=68175 RepID=UPI00342D2655
MNTDELEHALYVAERRVLNIQTKLHRWARDDSHRRFDDLYNLVADPGFLLVAWDRVRSNKGARTAGVDGRTARSIEAGQGVEEFLDGLRSQLKDRSFCPLPVRERMIPKTGGKLRRLGIATIADRVAQASLKLVLEPIFEADFLPCSYGFRPNRRAHDAVAEVRYLTSKSYDWIVEGDIKACFDEISHAALMDRVRLRIEDKRVLALVKAFLKAGILGEDRLLRETTAGTPQGSILSPLLSNVALSVLDEYVAQAPGGPSTGKVERARRRRHGLPNYRLSRYADDWCLMVSGSRSDAETLREEIAVVLSTMGLRLSPEKTLITHIEDGLDFLGWHIQRHRKRGTSQHYIYTYPAKKAVQAAKRKVKMLCREVEVNQPLDDLLRRLNMALRGWCAYFRPGVSSATFAYLSHYTWQTVWRWMRRKHRRSTWKELRNRY